MTTGSTMRRRKGPVPRELADRFWEKVEKRPDSGPEEQDGCWVWQAGTNGSGGVVNLGPLGSFSTRNAHRVAWFLEHGSWPAGSLWRCRRNLLCVRPGHCRLEMPPDVERRRRELARFSWKSPPPKRQTRVEMIRALAARKKGE